MHSTRLAARKNIFKIFLIHFSVFLVILGGLQPVLTVPAQAAEKITINDTDSYATVRANDAAINTMITNSVACPAPVALINGSFEEGPRDGRYIFPEGEIPGWQTTDKVLEIWDYENSTPSVVRNFSPPPDGQRYAEIVNLHQDVETTPGQTLYWRLSHMGRAGIDTMQVRIGSATVGPGDAAIQAQFSTGNTAWKAYSGTYTVPSGQMKTSFVLKGIATASGNMGAGNLVDDIFFGTEPCVTAEKLVSPKGEVLVGDELTYEITVKNTGGDIAADAVFEDLIPEGTEYVPGSLKIINGPGTGDLTDQNGDDAGRLDGGKVIVELGDMPNTNDSPEGITLQFKAKVLSAYAGKEIKNRAQISYDNLLTSEQEQMESNETTTQVRFNDPVLESNKQAVIQEKAAGNTDIDHPEVGDTLRYTIQARNTVDMSLVSDLFISDDLPLGLQYVPGSLKVDGASVTDAEGDDSGLHTDGQVVGLFGDILDKNWHSLEFNAVIEPGQAGKDIRNVAVVSGENIDAPSKSEEEVMVYPRHPVLESEKTVANLVMGKDNFEVGDTLQYTIRTRTVVSNTYVDNMTITDTLPAGLEYVPGSLEVDGVSATDDQGDDNGHYVSVTGSVYGGFGDIWDMDWHTLQFQARIQPGQEGKNIRNIAMVNGGNLDAPGMPEEEVRVYPRNPIVLSEKAAVNLDTNKNSFEIGDTVAYTIRTRTVTSNTYMTNLGISDILPAGLEYVPGSLKVDGMAITDDKDGDQGHYDSGQVVGRFGDIKDTKWHTLEFRAKITSELAGQTIRNVGEVTGDNIGEPKRPAESIVIENGGTPPVTPPDVTPPVVTPPTPVIESRKTSRDVNGGSIKVGDTLEYTITARNTVSGSLVSNLIISDELPEGLEYVAGSLNVDSSLVTDNADGDKGQYADGKVAGSFGSIYDTNWHTIVFHVTVKAGQADKTIINVGEVTGDNIAIPEKPYDEVDVVDGDNGNDGNNPDEPENPGDSEDGDTTVPTPDNGTKVPPGDSGSEPPHSGQTGGSTPGPEKETAEKNSGSGQKLPNTATNMYTYMLAGCIILLAGLFLLRRKKA